MNKKRLPIGISEFRETIEGNYYYVDKTKIIEEIQEGGSKVILFTRPRRFGKTLNMTMMRDFFDCKKNTKELYETLYIGKSTYFKQINKYPTLFFSFRDSKGDKQTLVQLIKSTIREEYNNNSFIFSKILPEEKTEYRKIYKELEDESSITITYTQKSIQFLIKQLSIYYKMPVMLFIDEYDTPMMNSYIEGYYKEMRVFFNTLYATALKDNPYLKQCVLTGIQRIAKENVFSGLNNLEVATVLDYEYNKYFGITPNEAKELLGYYNIDLDEKVKQVYNGYNFGGQKVYNPWSLINYAKSKILRPYWVNTSANELIKNNILKAGEDFKTEYEMLISNKEIEISLNIETSFFELNNTATLWGLLLNAGYITIKEDFDYINRTAVITIPNVEVLSEFQRITSEYIGIGESSLVFLFKYLIQKPNLEKFKQLYRNIIINNTSFYDCKENAYHMLFLGMCIYMDSYYKINSNIETGKGRSDIIMKSLNLNYPHLVIEFKQGEKLDVLAKDAIKQIKEKKYYAGLSGKVILLAVAHNKKDCEIISEEMIVNMEDL